MNNGIFSKDEFAKVIGFLNLNSSFNIDYAYKIYSLANEGITYLGSQTNTLNNKSLNQYEIVYYTIGEIEYTFVNKTPEAINDLVKNEDIANEMSSVVADKYLSLSMFNHIERKLTNKFLPPASSLNTYLNFMLHIVGGQTKNDPQTTLIGDLLNKSLSMARCTLQLLIDGYETEAFASWRTLHECECTLIILAQYNKSIIDVYLKHMNFGLAYKNAISDKAKQDEIFFSMKNEMKEYDLKSKDIKKYIEYGWLYSVPGVKEDETFKLNFRDGLEKVAGLSKYASRYELSSEIIHSTPILIYSNKDYFYYLTLLSLYESFFRLEKVFVSLFAPSVSEDLRNKYKAIRDVYYAQLVAIHKRETENFKHLSRK